MVVDLDRESDWTGIHVVVAGIGIAGFAAADALLGLGARVTAVDAADGPAHRLAVLDEVLDDVEAMLRFRLS